MYDPWIAIQGMKDVIRQYNMKNELESIAERLSESYLLTHRELAYAFSLLGYQEFIPFTENELNSLLFDKG